LSAQRNESNYTNSEKYLNARQLMKAVTVTTTLRRRVSIQTRRLTTIKQQVLGSTYELSLVLIGNTRAQTLNNMYRKKNKPTNVLSFPLSNTEGEIFINVPLAQKEARTARRSLSKHITYLFIHGVLHLKGCRHGATMEAEEQRLSSKFLI